MKKAILFDLYDTVLKDISFSVQQCFEWLYENYFKEVCTREEFEAYREAFTPIYTKRAEDNSEVHFMRDEIVKIFEHFGVECPDDLEELEYALMNQMQQETLLKAVKDTLLELHDKGIGMYMLSNSIFSGKATERLLGDFNILKYFKRVFVSADYGIRKPHPGFFQLAVEEIQKDYPDIQKEDILFVGNDYTSDVQGAIDAELEVVWYNVAEQAEEKEISTYSIRDFKELLNIISL